ncbi:6-phospho-3-hexuloisomerase [Paenibacillus sp. N3.4]|uniref:6-phospho-3-hexuloisomerase n=1 Tax=Paenibacillus sp. N3.4 TaxID=2603222 RepID=UPI0011CC20D0|nr:6-phospho-3-hexuloisomerase [Paenibacillus sp. N3.4]TXK80600.1 6-phospho-3-hexuloisomerase [Paenibacillus sp. N3.4]
MKNDTYLVNIIQELQIAAKQLDEDQAEKLVERITQSGKIFVAGAGRSGLMMRALAMRLMHLGIQAYVVGESVTPSLSAQDLLIIGSGSGETSSLLSMAEKAKNLGASVAAVTIFPESSIGRLADHVVKLPGSPKDPLHRAYSTIQPMGSLFEQTLLLFADALILMLMEKEGYSNETMYGRHANLE